MKTLIYIGANQGYGLYRLLSSRKFDKVYAFEPDPEIFAVLTRNYQQAPFVELINAACYTDNGTKTLHITENRVSSSLSDVNMENQKELGGHSGGKPAFKKVQIKTINLLDFLKEKKIEEVDLLVTDCQGADTIVLETIKEFLDAKKIKELFCETHRDNTILYTDLDNSFSKFKTILENNYEISYFSADGTIIEKEKTDEITKHAEWDTCWKLKAAS